MIIESSCMCNTFKIAELIGSLHAQINTQIVQKINNLLFL